MKLLRIALKNLHETDVFLRFSAEVDTELARSIDQYGLLVPLTVIRQEEKYIIISGFRRFKALQWLKHEFCYCNVLKLDEQKVLTAQIICSIHHVPFTKLQYALALSKLIAQQSNLTLNTLCMKLKRDKKWVYKMLDLHKMSHKVKQELESGNMCLGNAYYLSKVPVSFRKSFEKEACSMKMEEFAPKIADFIREEQLRALEKKINRKKIVKNC